MYGLVIGSGITSPSISSRFSIRDSSLLFSGLIKRYLWLVQFMKKLRKNQPESHKEQEDDSFVAHKIPIKSLLINSSFTLRLIFKSQAPCTEIDISQATNILMKRTLKAIRTGNRIN